MSPDQRLLQYPQTKSIPVNVSDFVISICIIQIYKVYDLCSSAANHKIIVAEQCGLYGEIILAWNGET
jgi:hypothetical protein